MHQDHEHEHEHEHEHQEARDARLLAEAEALDRAYAEADACDEARRLAWLAQTGGALSDAETEWEADEYQDARRAGLSRGTP